MVNGRQTPEHEYPISSSCESNGSGELKIKFTDRRSNKPSLDAQSGQLPTALGCLTGMNSKTCKDFCHFCLYYQECDHQDNMSV